MKDEQYTKKTDTTTTVSAPSSSTGDFVCEQLLVSISKLIELYKIGDESINFRNAHYDFLWFTSLADNNALGVAYDFMCKDGEYLNLPIDCQMVFGRVYITEIASNEPKKAYLVFENLINPYTDPGEDEYIQKLLLGVNGS